MFWLKLTGPILLILVSFFRVIIAHIWADRRTKKYKNVRRIYISTIILAGIFSIVTISIDDKKSSDTISYLSSLKDTADSTSAILESRELEAKQERKNLLSNIDSLQQMLDPFIKYAMKKYPNSKPNDALQHLENDIRNLKVKTNILEQKSNIVQSFELDLFVIPLSPNEGKNERAFIPPVSAVLWRDKEDSELPALFLKSNWIYCYKNNNNLWQFHFPYHKSEDRPSNKLNISDIEKYKNLQFYSKFLQGVHNSQSIEISINIKINGVLSYSQKINGQISRPVPEYMTISFSNGLAGLSENYKREIESKDLH